MAEQQNQGITIDIPVMQPQPNAARPGGAQVGAGSAQQRVIFTDPSMPSLVGRSGTVVRQRNADIFEVQFDGREGTYLVGRNLVQMSDGNATAGAALPPPTSVVESVTDDLIADAFMASMSRKNVPGEYEVYRGDNGLGAIRPYVPPPEPTFMDQALDVAGDIGQGVLRGVNEGVVNATKAMGIPGTDINLDTLATWLTENIGGGFDVQAPEGTAGNIAQGFAEYIPTLAIGFGGAAQAAKAIGGMASWLQGTAAGAIADYMADPTDPTLGDLAVEIGEMDNETAEAVRQAFAETLARDGDDTELVARLKQVGGGLLAGAVIDGLVATYRGVRAARTAVPELYESFMDRMSMQLSSVSPRDARLRRDERRAARAGNAFRQRMERYATGSYTDDPAAPITSRTANDPQTQQQLREREVVEQEAARLQEINDTASRILGDERLAVNTLPDLFDANPAELLPPGERKFNKRTFAQMLDERYRQAGVEVFTGFNEESKERVARRIAHEAHLALQREGHAGGWYNIKLRETQELARAMHPEITPGSTAEGMFMFGLALLSNGMTVSKNADYADVFYRAFKESGSVAQAFDTVMADAGGMGKPQAAVRAQALVADKMIAAHGLDGFAKFLKTPFTVRELKAMGYDVTGEGVDHATYGSVVFGPKIGGGFYQNLIGNYEPVTFDRWFMASWGRWTGQSFEAASEKTQAAQLAKFRAALQESGFKANQRTMNKLMRDDDYAIEVASSLFKDYSRGGFKDRTALNKAAQRLAEGAIGGMVDYPQSSKARAFMRETVQQSLEYLRQEGIDITPADLQATVWYPEKDLLQYFGVGNERSAPTDFSAEFQRILREKGYTDEQVNAALQRASLQSPERGGNPERAGVSDLQRSGENGSVREGLSRGNEGEARAEVGGAAEARARTRGGRGAQETAPRGGGGGISPGERERLAVQGGALRSKPNLTRIASALDEHSFINQNPMDLRPQDRNGLYYYFDEKTGGLAAEEWARGERLERKTFNEQSTLKTLRDFLGYSVAPATAVGAGAAMKEEDRGNGS